MFRIVSRAVFVDFGDETLLIDAQGKCLSEEGKVCHSEYQLPSLFPPLSPQPLQLCAETRWPFYSGPLSVLECSCNYYLLGCARVLCCDCRSRGHCCPLCVSHGWLSLLWTLMGNWKPAAGGRCLVGVPLAICLGNAWAATRVSFDNNSFDRVQPPFMLSKKRANELTNEGNSKQSAKRAVNGPLS